MPLQAGHKLAHYEIIEPIGKGGMGEVFRAHDSKLGRDVAIKVLPDELAQDKERLRRFQREAKVLASLNHPNIASIYGLEQSNDTHYLVLELVPGETLAERISKSPIHVEEAHVIATQIAHALEEAHERGIVHRDLKPANIKLTPDGKVKVLDFGLAKAFVEDPPESGSPSTSPTITRDATRAGVILGTASYMSPEQAKGKAVDKRTDIFAFGAVLYEMLTRKKAFPGDAVSEVLAAVIHLEPDWKALSSTEPRLRELLERSLEKDPMLRWRDIGDVRVELGHVENGPPPVEGKPAFLRWGLVALSAVALVVSAAVFVSRESSPDTPVKTVVTLQSGESLGVASVGGNNSSRTAFALSPDGTFIVYSAGSEDQTRLYRRSLSDFDAVPLENTEGASAPLVSPDGSWIAFWADGKLKKVPAAGGPAVTLCETSSLPPFGSSWGPNDTIVFAERAAGIFAVSADGGRPREMTSLAEGEYAHRLPQLLPDGETLIFTSMRRERSWDDASIVAQSLTSGERSVLVENASDGRYVPSGHLVFLRQGTLMAMPMDPTVPRVTGGAVGILDGVQHAINAGNTSNDTGAGQWSVSSSGSLAFVPGSVYPDREKALFWVDRNGNREPLPVEARDYTKPRISPDGRRAVMRRDGDIWVLDLETAAWNRLTVEGGMSPLWTSDGKNILFASNRSGRLQTYRIPADGSGVAERFSESEPPDTNAASLSPDGELLIAVTRTPGAAQTDLWLVEKDGEARPFIESPYRETFPSFSPDGRWIVYRSDISGTRELYVTTFPQPGARIPISGGHGQEPGWSWDGKELFFVTDRGDGTFAFKVIDVEASGEFTDVRPKTLFEMNSHHNETIPQRGYDISPGGKRFLMVRYVEREDLVITTIHLVQNWFSELERLVPTDE